MKQYYNSSKNKKVMSKENLFSTEAIKKLKAPSRGALARYCPGAGAAGIPIFCDI